jgi:hypothetical protein
VHAKKVNFNPNLPILSFHESSQDFAVATNVVGSTDTFRSPSTGPSAP